MSVANSLIVKSILSEDFKFSDPSNGAANKKTILNRVKKMDQAERKELLVDLAAVIKDVNETSKAPSLNEKAVCTLLLADDGKAPTDWCWLARVVIWVRNHFGRVSSGTVMTKLEAAIGVLNEKSVDPGFMDVETELHARMETLQAQIDDRTKENNVHLVLRSVDDFRANNVKSLFDADWGNLATYINLETNLDLLQQFAVLKVTDGKVGAFINETKKSILDLIKNCDKYRYKSELIGAISLQLRYMEVKLEDHLSSIHDVKKQLQKEKALVQKRLENYKNNVNNADERKKSSAAKNQFGGAAAQIRNLNQIIGIIDGLTEKKESLPALVTYIKYSNSHLQAATDSLKNTQNFAQHFALLAQFAANDGSLNKQDLANVIDTAHLADASHTDLAKSLSSFKSAPDRYSTDEHKRQLINDIVAYWKIVFDKLKAQQNQLLDDGKTKIKPKKVASATPVPAPVPVTKPAQAPALYPAVLISSPVVSSHSALPAHFVIPSAASDGLKALAVDKDKIAASVSRLQTIAVSLQANRENNKADYAYYIQVDATNIDNGILQAVYGNFYWIMKDKLQTLDSDANWGGNVFTKGKTVSGAVPNIAQPLLNHCRVQAIVEALKGHFRKGENQNP